MPEPYNWQVDVPVLGESLPVDLQVSWNGRGWELTLPAVSDSVLRALVGGKAADHLICERDEAYEIMRHPKGGGDG